MIGFILSALAMIASCVHQAPEVIFNRPAEPAAQQAPREVVPSIGIVLVGDTGKGNDGQRAVARGMEQYCLTARCDFGILLGDNFYPLGVRSTDDKQFQTKFEEVYQNLRFPFFVAIGNHDTYGNQQAQIDYESDRFRSPGFYYTMRHPLIDIVVINSTYGALQAPIRGRAQRKWIEGELKTLTAPWKLVAGHQPIFSGGMHGKDLELHSWLKPTLERAKVDFYVAGHDHSKQLIVRDGIQHIVSGAGSEPTSVRRISGTEFANATLGFAHLLIEPTRATLRFVDQNGHVEHAKIIDKLPAK